MRAHNRSNALLLVALLLVITAQPAHAYIDPGTGSFVLQAAIAGLLGAAYALKTFWWRIASSMKRIGSRRDGDGPIDR
jgi:hypothetical protein